MIKQVTVPQLTELHELIKCKKINRENLQTFLRSVQATEMKKDLDASLNTLADFKVWKTIKLGVDPKTADEFRSAMKAAGYEISVWANDILGKVTMATEENEVKLAAVSARDLGFTEPPTRKEIYDRAIELGLQICPAEVGPQLRLQYADQPKDDRVWIGMGLITNSDGVLLVFGVERDGGGVAGLHARYDKPARRWRLDDRWVFVLPG